jgi:MFS family permease
VGNRSSVRRLAIAATISVLGSDAAFVALAVEIYRRTHSAVWLAAMMLLTFGITGVIKPFAGALGDRFDRRRVMIGSDLLGVLAFGALGFIDSPSVLLGVAFVAAGRPDSVRTRRFGGPPEPRR